MPQAAGKNGIKLFVLKGQIKKELFETDWKIDTSNMGLCTKDVHP